MVFNSGNASPPSRSPRLFLIRRAGIRKDISRGACEVLAFCGRNTIVLSLRGPALVFAQQPKMARELSAKDPASAVRVIVQFKSALSPEQHQRVTSRQGTLRHELGLIKSGAYTVPAARLQELAADPAVAHISEDHMLKGMLNNTAGAVNVDAAWDRGLTGSGIGVAIIDSGISDVDDLRRHGSRIVYRENFLQSAQATSTGDFYGHGEHVAGIVGGNGDDSSCWLCFKTFRGMAPRVNLIDLRVLDSQGNGTDSYVIAAIGRAIQLKELFNIRVINISLGRPIFESYTVDPLCQAVEAAWQAGIVVVVAAGNDGRDNSFQNDGYGTINAPGNDPLVITVGAMKTMGTPQRTDDLIASYSSKGPTLVDHIVKPDLVAPGNQVVSLLAPAGTLQGAFPANDVPLNYYQWTWWSGPSGKYFTLSGTSMAAPS